MSRAVRKATGHELKGAFNVTADEHVIEGAYRAPVDGPEAVRAEGLQEAVVETGHPQAAIVFLEALEQHAIEAAIVEGADLAVVQSLEP
jgi:hypothetical protein